MSTDLKSSCHQFADDTSLIKYLDDPVKSIRDINDDLKKLADWANTWRVTFNASKTNFLRFSFKRRQPDLDPIFLNDTQISEVTSATNLGITLTNNLSWDNHIDKICVKTGKRLSILSRCRCFLPRLSLESLYISMIRPVIEYGDIIYDNTTLKNKLRLDNLQRKAAIICTGAYRHTETRSLLHELAWEPLVQRRSNHKIIQIYKIINGIYPNYLLELISPFHNDAYNLRNIHRFNAKTRRTEISNSSFFPSVIRLWYSQPIPIRESITVSQLRHRLNVNKVKSSRFNRLCTGKFGIQLTRLRLGLSALNAHRYKYNFIDTPLCDQCQITAETTFHYFFSCSSYSDARQHFFDRLFTDLNIDAINYSKTDLLNVLLFGLVNKNQQPTLLQIIFDYIEKTNRFQ